MTRSAPGYLAALLAMAAVAPPPGARLAAQECRLPATTKVEKNRLSLPVTGAAERVTISVEGITATAWQRSADNRSLIAELSLAPDLEPARPYQVRAAVVRAPLQHELEALETESARALAASAALDTNGLRRTAEAGLRQSCRTWTLPGFRDVVTTDAWTKLPMARHSLARRRAASSGAAAALARALAPATPWREALAALRAQAAKPSAATAREIVRLDALAEADPADTAATRLPGLSERLERVTDLLATWHARPPDSVAPAAVREARGQVLRLEEAARALVRLRSLIPAARADSARITAELAAVMRSQLGRPGTITDSLIGTITLPAEDEGKLRVGVGLHYTAPLDEPIFGAPGATNRVYPDVFLHWSPSARGTRRPVTIDFGLALNTVGRRGEMRDLFWRSSLLLGASVHPKGLVRLGAGIQLVRELTPEGRNKVRIPLYVSVSVFQFKL